ncbi:MAG TPA: hypothetical protein GXX14_06890 [Clostridiaceae bacterium]|nr:hypothetical protein [Clostridiaceae bacterium]
MTPRERVHIAVSGGRADKIPFTVYSNKISYSDVERKLRNNGMCIIERVLSYSVVYPDIDIKTIVYDENGRHYRKTIYRTPVGELSSLVEVDDKTTWVHEYLFKSKEDYKALFFLIKNAVAVPNYKYIADFQDMRGEDYLIRDHISYEPLNYIAIQCMGLETFSYEWMDNRDEIMKLYNAQVEFSRTVYPIIADGPLKTVNYGGNYMPAFFGGKDYNKYFAPHYAEAAEILHKKGKLLGSHYDDNIKPVIYEVADSALDYIEAYDVGLNLSVSETRKIIKNKALWLNFPCAWHLESPEEIYKRTVELIKQAGNGEGFLIGITEDVPMDRWKQNYTAILNAINENS